jgi:hypothetical protein
MAANLLCIGCNQMACPNPGRNPGCHRHNRSPAIGGGNPDPVTIRNCPRHDCRQAGRPCCRCHRHNDPHPGVRFCPSSHLFGGNRLIACPRLPRRACRTADKIPPESLGRVTGLLQEIIAWQLPQRGRTCQQIESYSLLPPLDLLLYERSVPCRNSERIRLLTDPAYEIPDTAIVRFRSTAVLQVPRPAGASEIVVCRAVRLTR